MTPNDSEKLAAELQQRNDMVRQLDRLVTTMMQTGATAAASGDLIGALEAYAQAAGAQRVWHEVVARRERPGKIDRDKNLKEKLDTARSMLVEKLGHATAPTPR